MDTARHIIVTGTVQGVGFRYSTQRQASRYGLSGYVRNMQNGSVEIVCEGSEEDLEKFLSWVKTGPPGAYVREARITTIPYKGTYRRFSVAF